MGNPETTVKVNILKEKNVNVVTVNTARLHGCKVMCRYYDNYIGLRKN